MGLLDNGIAGLAKEAGVPESSSKDDGDEYRKPLGTTTFNEFGGNLVDQGVEVELARIESPAGIKRRWGYGRADAPANQAYLYGQLYNADDEQIHGELSFEWENSTGRESEVQDEAQTEDMNTTDRYDRERQLPMPERTSKEQATHNEYLVVKFTPTTDPADITNNYEIAQPNSEVRWVATEYDVS